MKKGAFVIGLLTLAASLLTAFAVLKSKSKPRRVRTSRPLHQPQ